ncbi:hypothetical protein B0T16DRAFT_456934 [Cercophora newfieldiana]|uniref:Uncharacterized protein n=1 Tax=Cercophora newfieldiana TaxID=92897 RepID=A0AA39YDI9_9PEZI|nr:hypothetical protein B0T16DRAFT_456934 [Cercophora newfieldiana]
MPGSDFNKFGKGDPWMLGTTDLIPAPLFRALEAPSLLNLLPPDFSSSSALVSAKTSDYDDYYDGCDDSSDGFDDSSDGYDDYDNDRDGLNDSDDGHHGGHHGDNGADYQDRGNNDRHTARDTYSQNNSHRVTDDHGVGGTRSGYTEHYVTEGRNTGYVEDTRVGYNDSRDANYDRG